MRMQIFFGYKVTSTMKIHENFTAGAVRQYKLLDITML